jgi:O-antigen/teichoic acid export membrane protein
VSSTDPQSKSLSSAVSSGVIWMLAATIVAKSASLIAQIVLGRVLLEEDFGVYALAISVTVVAQVLRDGGARKVLIQKGARRFDKLVVPVFWLALCFNILTAAVIIGVAPIAARIYDEPGLVPLLVVIAISSAISTHGTMYRAKLAAELRYGQLARFRSSVVIIKNFSMIVLALLGFGAMSFAYPFIVVSIAEWIIGLWMCGRLRLLRSPRFRLWPKLFGVSYWMLVATLALAVVNQGPYAIVGYFVPTAVLGVYYFASQLVLQINLILAVNLQDVLLPALSSMNSTRQRQSTAVVRTIRLLAYSSSCAAFGVASIAPEVEYLFWRGKWEQAVPAIQWMCVFIPFRMLQSILTPAVLSRSNYRLNAVLLLTQGAIISGFAFIAGVYYTDPWQFALVVGMGYAISIIVSSIAVCRFLDISWLGCSLSFAQPWLIGMSCMGASLWAKPFVTITRGEQDLTVLNMFILGAIFASLFMIASRLLLKDVLVEATNILPSKLRRPITRILLLQSP